MVLCNEVGVRMRANVADIIATILVIVGGLNWGLIGFFNYNLVDAIFGAGSIVARVVYAIIGLAAVYMIYDLYKLTSRQEMVSLRR